MSNSLQWYTWQLYWTGNGARLLPSETSELIPGLSTVKVTPHEDSYRALTRAFVSAVFMTMFVAGEVKVKFTQEQAMKAQRGSRGIAVLFL